MATPLQQAAFRRKIIYFAAIVGLFALSTVWRGKLEVPFGNKARAAADAPTQLNRLADRVSRHSVSALAERYDLRELDQGDPELAASTARLALVGMRGIVVTALWRAAQEKQKRNEFHEFDLYARTVAELQPNFITPWIFQSWNIAYNVSVENDKLGDMYYYIARGIELLATGDRRNTKIDRTSTDGRMIGSPDIRFQIGFYYQNKFGVSDKVATLRSLMQLSAIPPAERKPGLFIRERDGLETIELSEFRKFCEKNPQLVRRLRTKLNCRTPEEVVQFLKDNETIPKLYKNDTERADPFRGEPAFPIFPQRFPEGADEYHHASETDDSFDAFHAARAWFTYANTLVPPNKRNENNQPIPWRSPQPGEYDANRYRVPRSPALTIFVQGPPRAQTYLAERLTKEGWFDADSVWNPDEIAGERRPSTETWFPNQDVVLQATGNSRREWEKAFQMWTTHGEVWAKKIPQSVMDDLVSKAGVLSRTGVRLDVSDDDYALQGYSKEQVEAARSLVFLSQNLEVGQFERFLDGAEAEKDPDTVKARRLFWEAEEARQLAQVGRRAPELYTQALAQWRAILAKYPNFHRGKREGLVEEEAYEQELKLILMLKEDGSVRAKADQVAQAMPVLIPQALHPDFLNNYLRPDLRQVEAEKEAGTRIAAEMLVNVYPTRMTEAKEADRRAMERIQELTSIKIEPTVNAACSVLGSAVTPATRPVFFQKEQVNVARFVVENEFAWMRELKYETRERDPFGRWERGAYWVTPEVRERVLEKERLIRKAPPEIPPEGADGPPGQFQAIPTPG